MLAQPASSRATEKTVIADFNRKLAAKINEFKRSNSGVSVLRSFSASVNLTGLGYAGKKVSTWLWDANAAFTTVLDDPTKYGFKDATSYGTGDGIFWGCVAPCVCLNSSSECPLFLRRAGIITILHVRIPFLWI
jgi:hypothetical protein